MTILQREIMIEKQIEDDRQRVQKALVELSEAASKTVEMDNHGLCGGFGVAAYWDAYQAAVGSLQRRMDVYEGWLSGVEQMREQS